MMENYLQTNSDWGSHWETATGELCWASGAVTVISAGCTGAGLKPVKPEQLPRRLRQGASHELCTPQLITPQPASKSGEKQWVWQQLCFPEALNNALVQGDQGPCRAGKITQGRRGTT